MRLAFPPYGKTALRIAVGHDSRISAPALSESVLGGIEKTGNTAVFTGLSSTPSMFMLLKDERWACDGSVMITASHLPFNRNGLKFFTGQGGLESEDVKEILTSAAEGAPLSPTRGVRESKPYLERLRRRPRGKGKKRDGRKRSPYKANVSSSMRVTARADFTSIRC